MKAGNCFASWEARGPSLSQNFRRKKKLKLDESSKATGDPRFPQERHHAIERSIQSAFGWGNIGVVFRACETLNTFNVTEEQVIQLIKEQDDFNQREMLFKLLFPVVIMRQGLRAAGLKGGDAADPKAAKWFSEQYEKHQAERQAKSRGGNSDADWSPAPYSRPNRN